MSFNSFFELLLTEFPELADPTNREDAVQEFRLLELSLLPWKKVTREMARLALAWLAYNLGLRAEPPSAPHPVPEPPYHLEQGTMLRDLDAALETERQEAERLEQAA